MHLKIGSTIACFLCAFLSVGCATQPPHIYDDFVLDGQTSRLEGWLAARGEWTLLTTRDYENYSPYGAGSIPAKEIFQEETVFNYWLRDWVFVATSIASIGEKEP